MGIASFKIKDLKPLVDHAKAASEHRATYGSKKGKPALFLVHDQGIYLMSNGLPFLTNPAKPDSSQVVYAKGCDPDKDDEWWETARSIVGGDDFAECIPLKDVEAMLTTAEQSKFKTLRVDITEESISLLVC